MTQMANQYLNTPILSGVPVSKEKHGHLVVILSILIVILIVVGVTYWWNGSANNPQHASSPPIDKQAAMREKVLTGLSTGDMTEQERIQILQQLKTSPN